MAEEVAGIGFRKLTRRQKVCLATVLFVLAWVAVASSAAPPKNRQAGAQSPVSQSQTPIDPLASDLPFGIETRTPWTTSRVLGSPDPPDPYVTERVFPHMRFDRPLDMTISPDGKRWFVCEDPGLIYSFKNEPEVEQADLLLDIRRKDQRYLTPWEQRRMWSMVFHPRFHENGYIYVCYLDPKPQPTRCRICRFTIDKDSDPPTCNVDSEFLVLEWISPVDHHGGCLKFGPDGYLYFPAGDGSGIADGNNSGQDLSDLNAAMMRIDVDRTSNGRAYGIPPDNPFIERPRARPEIYAYGLRNIWKMSFDRQTGDLWAGDVGQDLWEMVYRVERGGNYGWSVTEGTHPFLEERKAGPDPILPPVFEHEHSEARSITGGYVYRGSRLKELIGQYIYGDFDTGKIWALQYDGKKVVSHRQLVDTALKLVAFGEGADGELLILDYTGTLHQLQPAPAPTPGKKLPEFPRLLSETGLFSSTPRHEPAPGVMAYDVNSPLWSDGASKERFLAVPGEEQIEFATNGGWKFPEGSVLVKTFALDLEEGNPKSRKRLETRLLHLEQNHWRGYVYLWNDQQTDATLQDRQALERTYSIKTPSGEIRKQTWHFPSRAECTLCHTMPDGFVLGLQALQMNKDHDYGGTRDNQLRALDHIKMFTKPLASYYPATKSADGTVLAPPKIDRLADPADATASLDARARSYLHANCAHCHMRWGGGNAEFQLLASLKLNETGLLGTPPKHGDFGIKQAALLTPGEPERSLILQRMLLVGKGRMPHIATSVVDVPAVTLIREWITSLKKPAD